MGIKNIGIKGAEMNNFNYFWKNKTIGLVGVGRIGKKTAKIAQAFGMKVIEYDKFQDES